VNKRIRAYEEEKARLTEEASKGETVKALGAKNMLAQIDSGPLKEELNKVHPSPSSYLAAPFPFSPLTFPPSLPYTPCRPRFALSSLFDTNYEYRL
jgi:hypothetical protein